MIKDFIKKFSSREFIRFLVGGGSAVIVDFIIYFILKNYINYNIAKAVSFIVGASVGFIINKFWTFNGSDKLYKEIIKYIFLYIFSLIINTYVNKSILDITNINIIAFLTATGTSTIINFIGQKFIVFYKKGENNERIY